MPNLRLGTIGMAAAAAITTIPTAVSANTSTVSYYQALAESPRVPALLSAEDRAYYTELFAAIRREDWPRVEELLAQGDRGPMHQLAMAEYYLHANSPEIPLDRLNDWLARDRSPPGRTDWPARDPARGRAITRPAGNPALFFDRLQPEADQAALGRRRFLAVRRRSAHPRRDHQ